MPVIEVIQPAVRRAVASTRNHRVGVIATEGTVTSRAYEDAFAAAPDLEIITQACPRFVEFVENGVITGEEVIEVAEKYLAPVQEAGVDTLVLGCTHYPMLAGAISYVMGPDVTLVSSAEETALDVYRQLRGGSLLRESRNGAAPRVRADCGGRGQRVLRAPLAAVPRPDARYDHEPAGGDDMRIHVIGCSGSFAGPGQRRLQLPPRARGRERTHLARAHGPRLRTLSNSLQSVIDPADLDAVQQDQPNQ